MKSSTLSPCDVYISETAAYADVILPESTYLERDEEIADKSGKIPPIIAPTCG